MALEIGTTAPAFTLRDQNRQEISLDDLRGNKTLLVFMPFAFSGVCGGEVCEIRDNMAALNDADASVVVITCDSPVVNAAWAADNGLEYPILSDFWPHGAVTQLYDTFNESLGVAHRSTYVLDENGVITDVVASGELGTPREFNAYVAALT